MRSSKEGCWVEGQPGGSGPHGQPPSPMVLVRMARPLRGASDTARVRLAGGLRTVRTPGWTPAKTHPPSSVALPPTRQSQSQSQLQSQSQSRPFCHSDKMTHPPISVTLFRGQQRVAPASVTAHVSCRGWGNDEKGKGGRLEGEEEESGRKQGHGGKGRVRGSKERKARWHSRRMRR